MHIIIFVIIVHSIRRCLDDCLAHLRRFQPPSQARPPAGPGGRAPEPLAPQLALARLGRRRLLLLLLLLLVAFDLQDCFAPFDPATRLPGRPPLRLSAPLSPLARQLDELLQRREVAGEVPHPGHRADEVAAVGLRSLGEQPSVITGWFNWLRANAISRLLTRPIATLGASSHMAKQTPENLS